MQRRKFIRTTGLSLASLFICPSVTANGKVGSTMNDPDEVTAVVNGNKVLLLRSGQQWSYKNLVVFLRKTATGIAIEINAPNTILTAVALSWKLPRKSTSLILNDHWERTYGDVSWHTGREKEELPWYFMEKNGKKTAGFGVKTGANAFCYWELADKGLQLTLDTRSGGNGVQLRDRNLKAAEIITLTGKEGDSAFETTRKFAQLMCSQPRLPKQPVYGINDWYFSYGNNSEALILEHTSLLAPLAEGLVNRPFSVIDAGWFKGPPSAPNDCCWGDDMRTPNDKFKDMGRLAVKIKKLGMRPGIWTRPLCAGYKDPQSLTLPVIKGREAGKPVLDPTIPENLERIKSYFNLYNQWGYELVKFDFTGFDLFGKWGFEMIADGGMTTRGWQMHDGSKTNAEIVRQLYRAIREAAGETYVLGCNTFSHLAAGLFEINRIGDDTSGNEWSRTRKMGVNTLAFRGLTQSVFYAADADCVGLTKKLPWSKNKQWMELLAKSGTPLFISAQPDALGAEQKETIKACFKLASGPLPVGEPLDWMENPFPKKWKLNGATETFDWD